VPGQSYLRAYRPEANIRRQVHGLYFLPPPAWQAVFIVFLILFLVVFGTIYAFFLPFIFAQKHNF